MFMSIGNFCQLSIELGLNIRQHCRLLQQCGSLTPMLTPGLLSYQLADAKLNSKFEMEMCFSLQ